MSDRTKNTTARTARSYYLVPSSSFLSMEGLIKGNIAQVKSSRSS